MRSVFWSPPLAQAHCEVDDADGYDTPLDQYPRDGDIGEMAIGVTPARIGDLRGQLHTRLGITNEVRT